ncbi:hypothetical protein [Paenibacillus sp. FSL R7-0337]|uniref:hypothetical protein n=1 Tax=Paenibacillus sp. FSL R7-0337 TaxID=1926588 RepID=UPI00096E9009|nr:hypothetical protein [Paenibacillus sp. FSL R7-0337]OMF89196.1 hypothetical protein BK147_25445 [Paenibacillus sp. FSL R7-0337]
MKQPKLVLIEGLPGFGKSTAAQLVYEILTEMNTGTQLVLEGNLDHPADYEGVACLTQAEYDELSRICGGNSGEELSAHTTCQDNNYLVGYRKIINAYGPLLSKEWMDRLTRKDVYELPLAQHRKLITARWRQFTESALTGPDTYVFDCCFIQNPVTMGMIRHDAAEEYMISYIQELEAIIKPLNPLLIVIEQDDLELAFRKAVRERPLEWSEGFIQYYTSQGYGLTQGHRGLKGTLEVLKSRSKLEDNIYNLLSLNKIKVNNSAYALEAYKQVLKDRLAAWCNPPAGS